MLALLLALTAVPADTVRYRISFPNAVHHEAQVAVTFPVGRRDILEIRMPRSSPGRYALHEFAKNVYGVAATDGRGRPLRVTWRDPYRWFVAGHDGTVTFTYTLFGDRADGTYTQIDRTHAHLNMPATFAYGVGLERRPVAVRFEVPAGSGWRAASQLVPTADPFTFAAPDLQYFMDSPTELSDFALRTWTVAGRGGRTDTIRLAVHHQGTDAELDAFTARAKAVVAEQIAIYGEPAPYDHGTYTFIADYLPWASGDGMEHRNSTILSATGSLAATAPRLLSTLSHEFFHSWNVERIRPASLEPFDFFRANASDALWFAEGFTSYFDALTIRRAGHLDDAAYARGIGGNVSAITTTGGRRFYGARDMSVQAPFVDAAASIDPQNRANTFLSYYTYGAAVGLGLDLTIRGRFPGKSLDGFMRAMWEAYGRTPRRYVVPTPYRVEDLERVLGRYVGDAAFAREFFARYVTGREIVDYPVLLLQAGFLVRPARTTAILGRVRVEPITTGGLVVASPVLAGEPVYEAGVETGDRLLQLDDRPLRTLEDWTAAAAGRTPGATSTLRFVRNAGGDTVTASVAWTRDPTLEVVPMETAGGTLTDAQRTFRAAWLGRRAP